MFALSGGIAGFANLLAHSLTDPSSEGEFVESDAGCVNIGIYSLFGKMYLHVFAYLCRLGCRPTHGTGSLCGK